MESTALEEKINKIRLRNEEIKRRYEEVEADKKNAAKLDALVAPIPSEDWPERKEPPEFSAPAPKQINRLKHSIRKHGEQGNQFYSGNDEGKRAHSFADGQGPPPDPKYNFLADSERDEHGEQINKDTERNRGRNKPTRGGFRRRGSGRDWHSKEQWGQQANPGDMTVPEYEAWRAERSRIDEARISRQRTAEGNWRREWDNDKVHLADDVSKRENRPTLGDVVTRHEHADNEKHYRSPRPPPRNSQYAPPPRDSHHGIGSNETNKYHSSPGDPEKRVVIATEKSIKVLVNHGATTTPKASVMSVKVSSPNIAGTGRVGPRQRPRVMYSSQSEVEVPSQENSRDFARQKSVDEKTKGRQQSDQSHKGTSPKSPHPQRRRDGDTTKSPFTQRKDNNDRAEGNGKASVRKDSQKSPFPQRRGNASTAYPPKSPRIHKKCTDSAKQKHSSESNNIGAVQNSITLDGDLHNLTDSSAATNDNDKSNDSLKSVENNDNKNDRLLSEESSIEASIITTVGPVSETVNNDAGNDSGEQKESLLLQESTRSSAVELIPEKNAENGEQSPKSSYGEASGSQDVKDSNREDAEADSTDSQAINNCSANSGLTSNDSGYIELPSNDSIHDISENDTTQTSGIADTSCESLQFANLSVEDHPVVESSNKVEPEVIDKQTTDAAQSSPSNLQVLSDSNNLSADVSEKEKPEESAIPDVVSEAADNSKTGAEAVNEIVNAEPTRVEAESKDTNSQREEAKMEELKDSEKSEIPGGEAETSVSVRDEIHENPKDATKDNAITTSAEIESKNEETVTAEKLPEVVEKALESKKTTSKDKLENANDACVEENIAVIETASGSPAIMKD